MIVGMVAHVITCPFCQQAEPVVRHGTNRGGTARCRCKACNKTFTPQPNTRKTTPQTEEKIMRALEERLSIEATARLLKVAKKTIYQVLKKRQQSAAGCAWGSAGAQAGRHRDGRVVHFQEA